jgi:sortase A
MTGTVHHAHKEGTRAGRRTVSGGRARRVRERGAFVAASWRGYHAGMEPTTDKGPGAQPEASPETPPGDAATIGSGDTTGTGTPTGARARGGRGRWARRLGDVLLIAGGLLLAYPFWSAGIAQVQQGRLSTAYEASSAAFAPVVARADSRKHDVPSKEVVRRLAVIYGKRVHAGDPIGRLRIPSIGLDRLVQQGVGGRAGLDPAGDHALLRSGPVHYAITPLPGAGDPFAVAGHRTTFGAPFNRLGDLRPGDAIYVDTPYARFRYAVVKTTIVLPNDVGVLNARGYALVLTTCTPMYSASHRMIVWAQLKRATPLRKTVAGRASGIH